MSGAPDPKPVEPEPTLIEQPGTIPDTFIPTEPETESLTEPEPTATEPEPKPEPEAKEAKKQPWFQTRINELTKARREAERKAAEAEARAAVIEASKPKEEGAPTTSLTREQYERDVKAEAARLVQQDQYQSRSRSWLDAGVKEYGMEEFNQRCDMVAALGASDKPEFMQIILDPDMVPDGHRVVAQLAENPDEAQRILSLDSPVKMAAALTRFAMTSQPEKKQVSNAPKPISPIGGTAKASAPTENEPIDSWMAKRRAEVAARRKKA